MSITETSYVSSGSVGDYFALLKPRVMSLVVFTALVGLVVAPGSIDLFTAFTALLCIAVGAGASGALNMWFDADIDRIMTRTALRPIPSGKISPGEALSFGLILSVGSVVVLGLFVHLVAAFLLAFTIFFYVVVYTMWLKRWTAQNIVIGGAAGAFPPMIGWACVTGGVSLESLILFLIIFFWTPPHFWALSLVKSEDYARAGIPMLPVVAGAFETRWQILIYSVLLAPLAVSPWFIGFGGAVYGIVSAFLSLVMIFLSLRVYLRGDTRSLMQLFAFSILFLFVLFAVLLGEHMVLS